MSEPVDFNPRTVLIRLFRAFENGKLPTALPGCPEVLGYDDMADWFLSRLLPTGAAGEDAVKAGMVHRMNAMHAALSEVLSLVEQDENVRFNLSKPQGTFLDGQPMGTVSLSYGLLVRIRHALSEAAYAPTPAREPVACGCDEDGVARSACITGGCQNPSGRVTVTEAMVEAAILKSYEPGIKHQPFDAWVRAILTAALEGCALGECGAMSRSPSLTEMATDVWRRIGNDLVLVRDAAGWRVHELMCLLESRPIGNHAETVEGAIKSAALNRSEP